MNADDQGGAGGWPAVSVVVATRNRPELLLRAVTSILGQSYPGDLECLVVFDQSQPTPGSSRRIQDLRIAQDLVADDPVQSFFRD
jgi:GT2 family glycosyltransferase